MNAQILDQNHCVQRNAHSRFACLSCTCFSREKLLVVIVTANCHVQLCAHCSHAHPKPFQKPFVLSEHLRSANMQLFKVFSLAVLCSISATAAARFTDEQECTSAKQHVSSDLSEALQKAWWNCSAVIIERLAQSSSVAALDNAFQTEQRAITKQLNALKSLLESSKPGKHMMLLRASN
jgi:hypothetical protein